jgi:murein DD-endopeptidase MepM/ murein hydrolase activator NlpD
MRGGILLLPLGALGAILIGGAHPPDSPAAGGWVGQAPGKLRLPVAGAIMTQGYGCTPFTLEPRASFCASGHFHSGIDLAAPQGTPVHAAAGGVVLVASNPAGYGLYLIVEHGGDLATLYGHLLSTPVQSGDRVQAGQLIGLMGSSGLSTGPHLHFEVRRQSRPVDPIPWLPSTS